jgi:hypothetical protein
VKFALWFCPAVLFGAITNVEVMGVTSTQAIVSYSLPAGAATPCKIELSQSASYTPLHHDVDATLFTGADRDNRPGSLGSGSSRRTIVLGTRGAAQVGNDQRRYSRALAVYTRHYGRINGDSACDAAGPVTFTFTTDTAVPGRTYGEPIPSLSSSPGIPAWPGFYDRTPVVDPQTGIKHVLVTLPGELPNTSGAGIGFTSASDVTGTWASPTSVLVDDGNSAVFSNANQAKLAVQINLPGVMNGPAVAGSSYENLEAAYLSALRLQVKAWYSGGGSPSSGNKTFDACINLAAGSTSAPCLTKTIKQALGNSQATVNYGTFALGLTEWFDQGGFDPVLAVRHTMPITIAGTSVTWAGSFLTGNKFDPINWTAGSRMNIPGSNCTNEICTMTSVKDDEHLTINESQTITSATAIVDPFTVLLWKDTASTDQISVQWIGLDYKSDSMASVTSSAMQDNPVGRLCGKNAVSGGYLCSVAPSANAQAWYWLKTTTAEANYLGLWKLPSGPNPGIQPTQFHATDPARFYSTQVKFGTDTALYEMKYYGDYSAVAPGTVLTANVVPDVTVACSPQPCLQAKLIDSDLEDKLIADQPGVAGLCAWQNFSTLPAYGSLGDGNIQYQMFCGPQDGPAIFGVYNPATQHFIYARSSLGHNPGETGYPLSRWGAVHSAILGRGTFLITPSGANSSFGGTPGTFDSYPAVGPWRMKTTGAMNNATDVSTSCPTRPGGSPIPASDPTNLPGYGWPTGTACKITTRATDGEPCDPSPWIYITGTVSTDGTSTVTGSGTNFRHGVVGKPIKINGTTYAITGWTSGTAITVNTTIPTGGPYTGNAAGGSGQWVIQGDPPGGSKCGVATDSWLQDAAPGDVFYVGTEFGVSGSGCTGCSTVPTCSGGGCTTYSDLYAAGSHVTNTEILRLLCRGVANVCTGVATDPWIMQRGFGGGPVINWPSGVSLYAASSASKASDGSFFNQFWDYSGNKTINDPALPGGHGYLLGDSTAYILGGNCPSGPTASWDGVTSSVCILARHGTGGWFSDPGVNIAFKPDWHSIHTIGYTNNSDDHPGYNFYVNPKWFAGSRVWTGQSNLPAAGSNPTGTLFRFTPAQRGCANSSSPGAGGGYASAAAQCLALEKIFSFWPTAGTRTMLNVSGPTATISGNLGDRYKYLIARARDQVLTDIPGTNPGDLLINAPSALGKSADAPSFTRNGGDTIAIGAPFNAAWLHGLIQQGFWRQDYAGANTRWLGHAFRRPGWYSYFDNTRHIPDGLGVLHVVQGLDGWRTSVLLAILPPFDDRLDSVNRADFVPIRVSLGPQPANASKARIRFGYAENGPVTGYYCTERQEACITDSAIAPFAFASESSLAPADCTSGCAIVVPALSGRTLYYAVDHLNSSGLLVSTGLPEVIAVQ